MESQTKVMDLNGADANSNDCLKREIVDNADDEPKLKKARPDEACTTVGEIQQSAAQSNSDKLEAPTTAPHRSPKKRLGVEQSKKKNNFIYGNYPQYYGYRNKEKDFHDIRLDVFAAQPELFRGKQVLDIGCNNGYITMEVAKRLPIKNIVGLDIDRSLIKQAQKTLTSRKKTFPPNSASSHAEEFPFNTRFVCGNYVVRDDVLLEIERAQFDVILCLSVTKWIHLNFGDAGLKQAFRRMYLQLHNGGKLILEPQAYDNYGRRKKMNDTIFANYKAITFFPKDFTAYLLSPEVGFQSMELMAVPEHSAAGFKRPIQIFTKQAVD